jgi:hypothetical protein
VTPSIPRTTTPTTSKIEVAVAVATVIQKGMNLPKGRVMLDYERWEIPKDGLFCVVGYLGPTEQMAARSVLDEAGNEVQEQINLDHVQIDLMSIIPDNSAVLRRREVSMSLDSIYSRNFMAANGIGLQPLQESMTDTSSLEPGGYLNRFTLRAKAFSTDSRTLTAAFFDKFSASLVTGSPAGSIPPKPLAIQP